MIREELKKYDLPDSPGVYRFYGPRKKLLYVGKATSLRDRVRSYFAPDIAKVRSQRIAQMVIDATALEWTKTRSVLEALILEAALIKKHQPPANTDEKDNKSYNYVIVTDEDFPRILVVRGRVLFDPTAKKDYIPRHTYGPFPHGGQLREAMKIIRHIFPFRDTCIPCNKGALCKPCFNRQIGLCPGVCSGEVNKREYAHMLRRITTLFEGNFAKLEKSLLNDMRSAAREEKFEHARGIKRQLEALKHVRDVSLIKDEIRSTGGSTRIEAYDVAHTGGDSTVGVMVVVDGLQPVKDAYRLFNIRSVTNDDPSALRELLTRRCNHSEWPYPKVVVVDGAEVQLHVAQQVLAQSQLHIPVVAVVKDEHHKADHLIGDQSAIKAFEKEILHANAEAHRFAIMRHRRRLRKNWLPVG